jgi:hypothetical protein
MLFFFAARVMWLLILMAALLALAATTRARRSEGGGGVGRLRGQPAPYAEVLAAALDACESDRDRARVARCVDAMRRSPTPEARDALLTTLWAIQRDARNDLPLASRLAAAIETIERPRAAAAARAYNDVLA